MSKAPEVGDVWCSQYGHKVYVDSTDKIVTSFYYRGLYRLCKKSVITKEFTAAYKYLGKSKANMNQLFEVQDDRV